MNRENKPQFNPETGGERSPEIAVDFRQWDGMPEKGEERIAATVGGVLEESRKLAKHDERHASWRQAVGKRLMWHIDR